MSQQSELQLKPVGEHGKDIFLCHTGANKPWVERLAERNKVSELADVTKGALFNHFDSKETLVTELMQMLLTRLDKQFDRLMAEEENSDGSFSRAYIRAAFSEGAAERKIWGELLSLMASKDQVGRVWNNWLGERLKRHSKTDSRIELRVVRLAADGVWLERIMNAKSKNLKGVEECLIEMTRIH
jgi:AcrR family transcriptional regulator